MMKSKFMKIVDEARLSTGKYPKENGKLMIHNGKGALVTSIGHFQYTSKLFDVDTDDTNTFIIDMNAIPKKGKYKLVFIDDVPYINIEDIRTARLVVGEHSIQFDDLMKMKDTKKIRMTCTPKELQKEFKNFAKKKQTTSYIKSGIWIDDNNMVSMIHGGFSMYFNQNFIQSDNNVHIDFYIIKALAKLQIIEMEYDNDHISFETELGVFIGKQSVADYPESWKNVITTINPLELDKDDIVIDIDAKWLKHFLEVHEDKKEIKAIRFNENKLKIGNDELTEIKLLDGDTCVQNDDFGFDIRFMLDILKMINGKDRFVAYKNGDYSININVGQNSSCLLMSIRLSV